MHVKSLHTAASLQEKKVLGGEGKGRGRAAEMRCPESTSGRTVRMGGGGKERQPLVQSPGDPREKPGLLGAGEQGRSSQRGWGIACVHWNSPPLLAPGPRMKLITSAPGDATSLPYSS